MAVFVTNSFGGALSMGLSSPELLGGAFLGCRLLFCPPGGSGFGGHSLALFGRHLLQAGFSALPALLAKELKCLFIQRHGPNVTPF